MNTDLALPTPPPAAEPTWPVSDHSAELVLDLLSARGWSLVSTPEANVHATSPDGRVYVGWLPEDPGAGADTSSSASTSPLLRAGLSNERCDWGSWGY
jgi:hypothetical protein